MALCAVQVRQLKGAERPYKISDAHGLHLLVQPNGQRYWRFAYRYGGKQRTLYFGVYPAVSLADARAKRDHARKLLAAGFDPVTVAREAELAASIASATFRSVSAEWLVKCEREGRADVTMDKQRWLLTFVLPTLGSRPIARISAHEVYQTLLKVEAKGLYETARRVRSSCSRIFRYAVATGRAERDVCVDLRGSLVTPKVKHLAALTKPREVGELMRAIDGYSGYSVTRVALRLAPHLFVRPGELRHAEWTEFDFDEAVWTIPAEKMKMRRPHSVPLSRQALAIIEEIRPETGRRRHLFPAQGKRDRPMSDATLGLALRRLGYSSDRMTAHGFRAMASTLLNQSGNWHPDAIERQLGHVDGNNVRRIYARGDYWDERVRMMQAWSDELDKLRAL